MCDCHTVFDSHKWRFLLVISAGMPIAFLSLNITGGGSALEKRKLISLTILFVIGIFLMGCSGGSSGGGETLPSKVLSWQPPTAYSDNTSLDASTDLDSYEIYVKEDGNFSDNDNEMASVSATGGAAGEVNTSFNLANLAPFIEKGITYHVSIRAVANNGLKSDFSPSASFSF